MKLPPDEVRILGKQWSVVLKPDLVDDEGAFGRTHIIEQLIEYTDACTPSQMRDTVIHELLHAIDLTMGLDMSEAQVHAMAAGLFAVLQDNPEFKTWLLDKPMPRR